RRRLDAGHHRRLCVGEACSAVAAGRPVVSGGPRLDQRHVPRSSQGQRTNPRPPRRADPHRPHFSRVTAMTLTLRYAARSDRGLIRSGNQDSVYAGPRLLAVADGMGGMAAGDVASNIVIATMAPLDEDVPGNAMVDTLRSAVDLANQQIRVAVDAN